MSMARSAWIPLLQTTKEFLQSIRSAYSYCDIIAVGIPPVTEDSTNAAATQTIIDQFNQAIAVACNDLGCKYLNSAEVLKKQPRLC